MSSPQPPPAPDLLSELPSPPPVPQEEEEEVEEEEWRMKKYVIVDVYSDTTTVELLDMRNNNYTIFSITTQIKTTSSREFLTWRSDV